MPGQVTCIVRSLLKLGLSCVLFTSQSEQVLSEKCETQVFSHGQLKYRLLYFSTLLYSTLNLLSQPINTSIRISNLQVSKKEKNALLER